MAYSGILLAAAFSAGLLQKTPLASLAQNAEQVFVRVGTYSRSDLPVVNFAGHYLPYAILALWAYDRSGERKRLDLLTGLPADSDVKVTGGQLESWLDGWVILEERDEPLSCPEGEGKCGRVLHGLGYKVFHHRERNEIVIAFRGTDFHNADDWISNLRWVTRFLPFYDHYKQVQRHIGAIIDRASAMHGQAAPKIVAVGHSLGGGLAQQAAYKDGRIREVYAFDPSTVTGYYDPDVAGKANSVGLKIDRIFQRGEILAYLRFVMTQLYPLSGINPQIRTVRFSFASKGTAIDHHSMDALTAGLVVAAGAPAEWSSKSRPLPDAPPGSRETSWIYDVVDRITGKVGR
jgi:pimeloyl-ACP methyl ester carboxylesterase